MHWKRFPRPHLPTNRFERPRKHSATAQWPLVGTGTLDSGNKRIRTPHPKLYSEIQRWSYPSGKRLFWNPNHIYQSGKTRFWRYFGTQIWDTGTPKSRPKSHLPKRKCRNLALFSGSDNVKNGTPNWTKIAFSRFGNCDLAVSENRFCFDNLILRFQNTTWGGGGFGTFVARI